MKIAYFWLTKKGKQTAELIMKVYGGTLYGKEAFSENVKAAFYSYDALVFFMATGLVVRTIAPFLQSKVTDPAVIVSDQNGKYVISLLSGHLGGANALACKIARVTGGEAVITTATDVQGVLAFDEVAKRNRLYIENLSELKWISGAMLEGKQIQLYSDIPLKEQPLPVQILVSKEKKLPYQVCITDKILPEEPNQKRLLLRPASIVVGVGCKKYTDSTELINCFLHFLQEHRLSVHAVAMIATISLKAHEPAILDLCERYQIPLKIVANEQIQKCTYPFVASEFVASVAGVSSVSEACSYLASGQGDVLTGKVKYPGITFAACRKKMSPIVLEETE